MWRKTNSLFLLVIFSLIMQTFSSVMWKLEKNSNDVEAVRKNRKERSLHRGAILSYPAEIKNKLCRDLFHAQLYEEGADLGEDESKGPQTAERTAAADQTAIVGETAAVGETEAGDSTYEDSSEESSEVGITDDPTNEDSPEHPLVAKRVTIDAKTLPDYDLLFVCAIVNPTNAELQNKLFLISTAFLPGWFYVSILDDERAGQAKARPEPAQLSHDTAKPSTELATPSAGQAQPSPEQEKLKQEEEVLSQEQRLSQGRVRLSHYMARSPWLLMEDKEELEERYAAVRDTLEVLKKESAEYVQLIEAKNDLTPLPTFKRKLLCASVLSSPMYQMERLQATPSFDFPDKPYDTRRLRVAFKDNTHDYKAFTTKCLPCYGYEDFDEDPSDDTEMCLAPSFNDQDSLYVLNERVQGDKRYLLSKYFEKVSILTNAREPVEETDIFVIQ